MKNLPRIILTLIIVSISYIIYKVTFELLPGVLPQFHPSHFMIRLMAIMISIVIGFIVWIKLGADSGELYKYILVGGITAGMIGFIFGFLGPIILFPSSNQGPLLGIFITGPLGFLFGLISGGFYWLIKIKKG